jgi:hypothetical protein
MNASVAIAPSSTLFRRGAHEHNLCSLLSAVALLTCSLALDGRHDEVLRLFLHLWLVSRGGIGRVLDLMIKSRRASRPTSVPAPRCCALTVSRILQAESLLDATLYNVLIGCVKECNPITPSLM